MAEVEGYTSDDNLALRFQTFTLTRAEEKEITIHGEDIKLSEAECRLSLIEKVVSSKPVNLHGIRNTMAPLWGNPAGFKVTEVGDNIFQFVFSKEADTLRVLGGKPLFFSDSFFILTRWTPELKIKQLLFQQSPIWIQVWGLPLEYLSSEVGQKIGSPMGEVTEVVIPEKGSRNGRIMLLLVDIDITASLRRGMKLKLDDGAPFWVEFRYEKLPTFCCYCGYLGHDQSACIKKFNDVKNDIFMDDQYGSWLRVSPGKSFGWKKYGDGGKRWSPTSPAKFGNGSSHNRGGNSGAVKFQFSKDGDFWERRDFNEV